jgi:hypothetical protein
MECACSCFVLFRDIRTVDDAPEMWPVPVRMINIRIRVTVFAEGARGSLSQGLWPSIGDLGHMTVYGGSPERAARDELGPPSVPARRFSEKGVCTAREEQY